MKIIVIGGSGHIGTFLIPRLITAGHEVFNISRQKQNPYVNHSAWKQVKQINIDREDAEKQNTFSKKISKLTPDIVIDLICFSPESARSLAESLNGKIRHLIHCGTIWVHGYAEQIPTTESQTRKPFGNYGIKKAEIENYLLDISHKTGFPVTILHPGHIVGPGWMPLNPAGNFNPEVFRKLSRGEEVILPNLGMECVHHVHADDVAQAFCKAINKHSQTIGESFHIVSGQALTLRGYAEAMSAWFGQKALLKFLPWEEWKKYYSEEDARATWDHIAHSPNCSIEKARRLLGYEPRYSSLQAVQESVSCLMSNGLL